MLSDLPTRQPRSHAVSQKLQQLTDRQLLDLARAGDMTMLAELWNRYHRLAYLVAYRTTSRFDADDLVAEAYSRIVLALRRGNGPQDRFGGYLATTIRSIATRWSRTSAEMNYADFASLESEQLADPNLDPALIVGVFDDPDLERAFRSLPQSWQYALWHSAVEDTSVAELAARLSLKPTAVSALTYRARKGLIREWDRLRGSD